MKNIKGLVLITLISAILLLLFWKPIGVNVISYFVYSDFKKEFDISSDFHTVRHIDDYAWLFGGTFGLPKLNKLKNNPKISPNGQKLAKEIFDHIYYGKHLEYLKMHKEAYQGLRDDIDCPSWPINVLKVYLYNHDVNKLMVGGQTTLTN